MLPTARTLEECRKRGWPAGVVERWKPGFREADEPEAARAARAAAVKLVREMVVVEAGVAATWEREAREKAPDADDLHLRACAAIGHSHRGFADRLEELAREIEGGARNAKVKEMIPYGTRVDFLGFADLLALDGQGGYLAIQACAGGDLMKRLHKAMDVPELREHLAQGNRFEVWGWRQILVQGKTAKVKRWRPKIVSVVLRDGMLFHQEGGDVNCRRPT